MASRFSEQVEIGGLVHLGLYNTTVQARRLITQWILFLMISKIGKSMILGQTNLVPGEALLPHRHPLSLAPLVADGAMDLLEFSLGTSLIST